MSNEKRLIDANLLVSDLAHSPAYSAAVFQKVAKIVHDAPTVDAVEVVHGHWVPIEYDGYADGNPVWDLWECSECQEEHSGDEDTLTPYCPNCGAKMDGGNEDG